MHSLPPRACKQHGLATIEFAICAPILLLLLLATAELGRLMSQYNTLAKAVRDGARYAATAATNSQRVVNITPAMLTATRNLVVTGSISGTGAALLPGLTVGTVQVTNNGMGFIRVSATYTYQPMFATLPAFGFGGALDVSLPLSAAVIMRA